MIKDKIFSVLHQIPTADLSTESLSALMAIMLAQAQEAFCLKAIQGTFVLSAKYLNLRTKVRKFCTTSWYIHVMLDRMHIYGCLND